MGEKEVKAELAVGGGLLPVEFRVSLSDRFGARGREVLEAVRTEVGDNQLDERLGASEELDALVSRAMISAAESGYRAKRALLGQIVRAAVLDDARIDESSLRVSLLQQIDAPHVRCLEAIARAEKEARESGEMGPQAPGAEKPLTMAVRGAIEAYPAILLQTLVQLGHHPDLSAAEF